MERTTNLVYVARKYKYLFLLELVIFLSLNYYILDCREYTKFYGKFSFFSVF